MNNAIIQFIFLIVIPFGSIAQIESSEDILFRAIQKRNEKIVLNAHIEYGGKNAGDLYPTKMDYKIAKILDDSIFIKRKMIGGKLIVYDIEIMDSLTHIESDTFNSTFTLDGYQRKKIGRNMGANSRYIKRMLGLNLDSSLSGTLISNPVDTIIFGIPCWKLIQSPYNTPVSKIIESSYFISRNDYVIRGFNEIEIYNGIDTVNKFSFIKQFNSDIYKTRENIKIVNMEIQVIMKKFSQKPTITFILDPNLYVGKVKKIQAIKIPIHDSVNLNFIKGRYFLDFWFIGCYPCMQSFPYIDSLERTYEKRDIKFIKINPLDGNKIDLVFRYTKLHKIDNNSYLIQRNLCSIFDVNSYPSFIFIEDGQIIKKFTGFDESVYDELKLFFEKWTADSR